MQSLLKFRPNKIHQANENQFKFDGKIIVNNKNFFRNPEHSFFF